MNYFISALKKYAVFSGRSRRKEYWFFALFYVLIGFGISILELVLGLGGENGESGILGIIYALGLFLPSFAVTIRRLHDIGKSGWWILIGVVPLIGWIWIFILLVKEGHQGPNTYGEDPKAVLA